MPIQLFLKGENATTHSSTSSRAKVKSRPTKSSKEEGRVAGKYRLKVVNIKTKQEDQVRQLELSVNKNFKTSDGVKGTWSIKSGKVVLEWGWGKGEFENRDGTLIGQIRNKNSGEEFRASAKRTEDRKDSGHQ